MFHIKKTLQRCTILVVAKQWLDHKLNRLKKKICNGSRGFSVVNLVQEFSTYCPFSAGGYIQRSKLTKLAIKQVPFLLANIAKDFGKCMSQTHSVSEFTAMFENCSSESERLGDLLRRAGSDKATTHDNYLVYASVLSSFDHPVSLLEIGLGTNNTDIVSNMGKFGVPGASLRAFRDFLPLSQIYGADVDKRILFEDERIKTYFVDQTNVSSLKELNLAIPGELDVIIDDGLHAPNANLASLLCLLGKLRLGGWYIVEDIYSAALPIWQTVPALLSEEFATYLIKAKSAYLFCITRIK